MIPSQEQIKNFFSQVLPPLLMSLRVFYHPIMAFSLLKKFLIGKCLDSHLRSLTLYQKDKKRWFVWTILAIVVIFLFYFFIFLPLNNYQMLKKEYRFLLKQQRLQMQLINSPVKNEQLNRPFAEENFDSVLLMHLNVLIEKSGLHIKRISLSSKKLTAKVELYLEGNFQMLNMFLDALDKQNYLIFLQRYFFKTVNRNQLIIRLNILIINALSKKAGFISDFASLKNPFCSSPEENFVSGFKHAKRRFPISQLKLVGFLNQEHHSQALVKSPDRMIQTVQLGDRIGEEQAKVMSMNEHEIVVGREAEFGKISK